MMNIPLLNLMFLVLHEFAHIDLALINQVLSSSMFPLHSLSFFDSRLLYSIMEILRFMNKKEFCVYYQ